MKKLVVMLLACLFMLNVGYSHEYCKQPCKEKMELKLSEKSKEELLLLELKSKIEKHIKVTKEDFSNTLNK